MDSVFVEVGYSGLESIEKNVFGKFLEIENVLSFLSNFKKVFVVEVLAR